MRRPAAVGMVADPAGRTGDLATRPFVQVHAARFRTTLSRKERGTMNVGILGTGDVANALGRGFSTLGHVVKMGSRDANNEKALAWARQSGPNASAGTFADAAAFGEIVVLATLGVANESVITMAGVENFRGKIVIDTTNPLDFSAGMPPRLALSGTDSGGEQVQRLLPDARVVKAFNTVGNKFMFRPQFTAGRPDMFICGNDAGAKATIGGILKDFGWGVIDVGGIESSRYLEAMCMVWVISALHTNNWNQAFKMLKQ
jgi:predicted dinucleotide-binding enzyme